jgi:hypothetical protein
MATSFINPLNCQVSPAISGFLPRYGLQLVCGIGRATFQRAHIANRKFQIIHLIDLAEIFLGDFTTVEGHTTTYFWKMPVHNNASLLLRNAAGNTAWLHVSCCEWKNLFSLKISRSDEAWQKINGFF